jgi:NADH-quinone oxidoreductase subunit E
MRPARHASGPAKPVPRRSLDGAYCMETSMKFDEQTLARFAREVAKYPADQKQSAVMACLAMVQLEQGHVSPEAELAVAEYLGMAPIAVHEVTTFYNMYNQRPVGRFKLNVCTNLPCQLREGDTALQHLCRKFGVEPYGTSADGLFTVQPSECLGACADAPVMLVNDRQMLSFMGPERLDELVDVLSAHASKEIS